MNSGTDTRFHTEYAARVASIPTARREASGYVTRQGFGRETGGVVGLCVSELVTNVVTHAYPGRRRGRFEVSIQQVDDSHLELTVADRGVGFADPPAPDGLGLQIVRSLCDPVVIERHDRTTSVTARIPLE
jgi:two-component sensor histidine kinase